MEDAAILGTTISLIGGFYVILRWTINGKLDDIRDRLESLETTTQTLHLKINHLCTQLTECKTDIAWLKEDRDRHG